MSLEGTFWVYGTLTDSDGNAIVGATVTANDITDPQGSETATTDSNGYWQINLQDIATDGDLINITFGSYCGFVTFTLDVDDLTYDASFEQKDGNYFKFVSDIGGVCMPFPYWNEEDGNITKNLVVFNFENGLISTVDKGIGERPYVIKGYFNRNDYTDAELSSLIETIWAIQNNNEPFTISNLHESINGTYVVKSFRFQTVKGSKYIFEWELQLELVTLE